MISYQTFNFLQKDICRAPAGALQISRGVEYADKLIVFHIAGRFGGLSRFGVSGFGGCRRGIGGLRPLPNDCLSIGVNGDDVIGVSGFGVLRGLLRHWERLVGSCGSILRPKTFFRPIQFI